MENKQATNSQVEASGLNGAALIDENGEEILITEDMIQQACEEMADNWIFPHSDEEQKH